MEGVKTVCETCEGRRFTAEVLEHRLRGKNIHEVLALSAREASDFFTEKAVRPLLQAALGVRAEEGRLHAVRAGERLADGVEHTAVRRDVRAARAARDALIDDDDVRVLLRETPAHQRALPRARDAGDDGQHALREGDRDVFQVVQARVLDADAARRGAHVPSQRLLAAELLPRARAGAKQTRDVTLIDHATAVHAGTGSHVDHVVGEPDHGWFVLDDEHRVPLVAQPREDRAHALDVVRV